MWENWPWIGTKNSVELPCGPEIYQSADFSTVLWCRIINIPSISLFSHFSWKMRQPVFPEFWQTSHHSTVSSPKNGNNKKNVLVCLIPCRLADRYWYFEGTYSLHLQSISVQGVGYSKSLLFDCHTPQNHIPKDCSVITHYHENFRSQNYLFQKFGWSCIWSVHSVPHLLDTVHQVCMFLVHLTCDFSFVIYTPISANVVMCKLSFCFVITSEPVQGFKKENGRL